MFGCSATNMTQFHSDWGVTVLQICIHPPAAPPSPHLICFDATAMAGRGRGRKMITFNMETVGVPRGDNVPVCVQQPTPLFPVRLL